MKNHVVLTLSFLLIAFLLTGCLKANDTRDKTDNNEFTTDVNPIYDKTINDFKKAIETKDPEALYELIDLNYEGEVYWTLTEAQDLIDFFSDHFFSYERQIQSLEESSIRIEAFKEAGVYTTDTTEKRIPVASSDDGLVFLQPDGKLSIKVFKHTLIVSKHSLGDFDEVTLDYKDTEKKFKYTQSDIKHNKYKNDSNEEVIDIMYVGPGNYKIESLGTYNGNDAEYETNITLTEHDMFTNIKTNNEEKIHLFFKKN